MWLQSLFGLFALTGLAWALSENRRGASWRVALGGLAVQLGVALVLLKLPGSRAAFGWMNEMILALQEATKAGTSVVFGYLGGGPLPFEEPWSGASFILAIQALPIVLVVSALSALLFHWRILPRIVGFFSWLLQKSMGVGGAVGVATASNIFVGMVESPLLIRPYLMQMSRSELFIVMTAGMATIAGTVLALYASIIGNVVPDAMGHILTASLISAPAAVMVARLMVPGTGEATEGAMTNPEEYSSAMDAVTRGTVEGLKLLLNICALLIVLIALVHLVNQGLGLLPELGGEVITLERLLGYVMAPVTWLMGIPWAEATTAGTLMGTKTILNEFLAYLQLAGLEEGALSPRSRLIMTYALCGFANFGSLGIMLGGLTTMAPERRSEIVGLGMKSIVAGTLATCLTGAVVGLLGG